MKLSCLPIWCMARHFFTCLLPHSSFLNQVLRIQPQIIWFENVRARRLCWFWDDDDERWPDSTSQILVFFLVSSLPKFCFFSLSLSQPQCERPPSLLWTHSHTHIRSWTRSLKSFTPSSIGVSTLRLIVWPVNAHMKWFAYYCLATLDNVYYEDSLYFSCKISLLYLSLSFSLVSIISLTHRNESSLEIVSQLNVSFCYHPVRLLVSKISWVVDVKVLYHFPLVVCLSTFCNPKVCPFRYRSIVLYIWSVLSCITRNSSKSCMFSYTRTYIMAPTTIFSTSILAKTKKAHTLQNNRSVSLLCLLWQHICCFEVIWSLVYL